MALKGKMEPVLYDINCFTTAVAERGGIVCNTGSASGASSDNASMTCGYVANPSGYAALGILLQDVVNKDLTQTHLDQHKDEVQLGSKAAILKQGWVVTNMIYPGDTPAVGGKVFIGHSGYLATSAKVSDSSAVAGVDNVVGRFETKKDENGYCRVYINVK